MEMKVDKRFTKYFKNLNQVWLYLTDECNLTCNHCLYKPNLIQKKKIRPELAKKLLKVGRELGAYKLSILGGEITLYNNYELEDILKYAKIDLGFDYLRIVTNGVYSKNIYTESFFNYIDEITFSVDGYDKSTHEILRGKNTFEKTIQNIIYSSELNKIVQITTCVTKENTEIAGGVEKFILNSIKFAESLKIDSINFHGVFEMGTPMDAWTSNSHLSPIKYFNAVRNISELIDKNSFSVNVRLPLHIIKRDQYEENYEYYGSYCPAKMGERFLIHPTGIIRICSSLLSSNMGVALFNENEIRWNDFNNEVDCLNKDKYSPCSQQSKLYSKDFIPICFSFKPKQNELVWKKLKSQGHGIIKEESNKI